MSDVDRVTRAMASRAGETPALPAQGDLSPILCVFKVLLSLDPRKTGWVDHRIERLREPDPGYGTLAGAKDYAATFAEVNGFSPRTFFNVELLDEGKRADLLLPLLDALIDAQRDHPGRTEEERVEAWARAASPFDWQLGPFRGLGLKGFQHLRMLLGANTAVPSKEHQLFVAAAVGRPVPPPEAALLLERAAGRLGYRLALLPVELWKVEEESRN